MNIVQRAKSMILSPKSEWEAIRIEPTPSRETISQYVLPLAAIAAIAAFIGYWLIGINAVFIHLGGIRWGLYYGLTSLIRDIIAVIVAGYVVDALAPSFQSEKNINKSMQLVGYAYTPVFIGGILAVIPALRFIGSLFGLYGIYLWYLGLTPLKGTPDDKRVTYMIVSILVLIVVYLVLGWILGMIFMGLFGLSMPNFSM